MIKVFEKKVWKTIKLILTFKISYVCRKFSLYINIVEKKIEKLVTGNTVLCSKKYLSVKKIDKY